MKWNQKIGLLLTTVCMWVGGVAAAADSYYKEPPLFSTAPSPGKSLQTIDRFGPVGMGVELHQPAFVMKVKNIEEGSPAAATGKLKAGQIIESINGDKLAHIDPRIQLAQILGAAEASDGVLKFMVADKPGGGTREVVVKIPVLGAYSDTWPLDCPKSDKIVRGFADYLAQPDAHKGFSDFGMLFLLATGEDLDLEVVRKWAHSLENKIPRYAWHLGFGGIPLCEYYLRTGDQEVLPTIQNWVDSAVAGQVLDGWAGRGGIAGVSYGGGGGHLNAGGTAVVTFLLLAKECGAEVPDYALLGALRHFYRYAGRGINPYGDGRPETSFVDNGRQGNLAFVMAAAASLTPEGEDSVYADARDHCAMTSFYTTTFMLHGHTGGGIGEIWRSAAMGLLHEKKPQQYREFMDHRCWHYDLSRRFDGSFGILGGARYDNVEWGNCYPMAYVIPRKTLRLTGAPPSKFSKKYQLPKCPWGTTADDVFVSIEPAQLPDGTRPDVSKETLTEDSAKPLISHLLTMNPIPDDVIRRYAHHPSFLIRRMAANNAMGFNPSYMWIQLGAPVRMELVHELFRSPNPRVRSAAISAMVLGFPSQEPEKCLTPEVFDGLIKMLQDPEESWWIKDLALQLVGKASPDRIVPHVDLVVSFLKHEEWWLQNAALVALAPVVADQRCYERVLPAIGDLLRTNQRWNVTAPLRWGPLPDNLGKAGPEVRKLAAATLKESFTGYEGVKTTRGGLDISSNFDSHMEFIAGTLANVPGGLDVLYEIARVRFPDEILPYKEFFLAADPSQFGPKLKKALTPIINDELIPEFVGRNRKTLRKLAAAEVQSAQPGGPADSIDGLVVLHQRAGHDQYAWHMFANLREAEWSYHSFDPIPAEQVPWDQIITRYREVTMPKGMENWFAPDFDPARAGWKRGKSPFGQYMGQIPKPPVSKCSAGCIGPVCYGATKVNTLWEKEALLLRGAFRTPAVKKGHRYRLRVNHTAHVGNGGGYCIYINGKLLIEQPICIGRGGGEKPKGAYITKEFMNDLKSGKVTIAVKSFLRFNDKYKVTPSERIPQGRISMHFEEQELPPMGDDLVLKAAAVVPMLSSEWQAKLDPEDNTQDPADNLFRWDGKFVVNPKIGGTWKLIAQVAEFDQFDPAKKPANLRNPPFDTITLKDGGKTSEPLWAWSGDTLMDLDRFQTLKMQAKNIDGTEYLFVEAGGFSTRNKPDWRSSWYVMKRQSH